MIPALLNALVMLVVPPCTSRRPLLLKNVWMLPRPATVPVGPLNNGVPWLTMAPLRLIVP